MLGVDLCGWNTLLDILAFGGVKKLLLFLINTSLKPILGQSVTVSGDKGGFISCFFGDCVGDLFFLNRMDEDKRESKKKEGLLKEYNESLMKLTRIENKVRGMNRFA